MDQNCQSSGIPTEQMTMKSEFSFACHKDVECFTRCCRGIDIMLTPYDILTMRKKLGITSEQFLSTFTRPQILEKADMPVVTLQLLDDERKSCPFVEDHTGCTIYEDRPTTCRYYPLGVGALSYSDNGKDPFFFMVKETHCMGFKEKKTWQVAQWREDQGVDLRDQVNQGWLELMVRKKSLPASMKLSEQSKRMFFMVCYNIDAFSRFVFESTFLQRYEVSQETIESIKTDEVKLLQFGFDWLKATLFHAGKDSFQLKKTA